MSLMFLTMSEFDEPSDDTVSVWSGVGTGFIGVSSSRAPSLIREPEK